MNENSPKFPCKICRAELMAHPDSECANCHLAIQIMGGARDRRELENTFIRTGQHDRIIGLDDSIRIIHAGIAAGRWKIEGSPRAGRRG